MGTRVCLWVVAASALVTGCSNPIEKLSEARCDSDSAQSALSEIIKGEIENSTAREASSNSIALPSGAVRAVIEQIDLIVEDVRTTEKDPKSTKRFCTGKLKVVFPEKIIRGSDDARAAVNLGNLFELASSNGFEKVANSFFRDVDYSIQPTDDGKKIYAEIDRELIAARPFFSEIVLSYLLKNRIEQNAAQEARRLAMEKAEQQRIADETKQSVLEEAQLENKLSIQQVAEVWQSLRSMDRQALVQFQKAWLSRKSADCAAEVRQMAGDRREVEIARLKCDTNANRARADWLRQRFPTDGAGGQQPTTDRQPLSQVYQESDEDKLVPRPLPPGNFFSDDDYPDSAREEEQEGVVRVKFVVGKTGKPIRCSVTQSSGYPALDERTCQVILSRFRYKPAVRNGVPVDYELSQPIRWRLNN